MAQQRADMTVPMSAGSDYSQSGQGATGGGTSVFGDLGGPGQQQGGGVMSAPQDGPRNAYGHPNGNPSGGDGWSTVPAADGVFGDLGGGGVACQTGGQEIPAAPAGTDTGGQGGYR